MPEVRHFKPSPDVVAYVRDELLAWRRDEPVTCAILKHNGRPYVVLQTNSGVVAVGEDGICWATQILDGLIAYDDPPPPVGSGHHLHALDRLEKANQRGRYD
jgi:hypothetical protein